MHMERFGGPHVTLRVFHFFCALCTAWRAVQHALDFRRGQFLSEIMGKLLIQTKENTRGSVMGHTQSLGDDPHAVATG